MHATAASGRSYRRAGAVDGPVAPVTSRVAATRAFFGPRAATWDDRFPGDGPRFELAVAALDVQVGAVVADVGCGTGRALAVLRRAVGPRGTVVGVDLTPEMLARARGRGGAGLVLADALALPFPDAVLGAVLAAGLVTHLPDPRAGLSELARVSAPGATLAVFHPVGRRALAALHGQGLGPGDVRDPGNVGAALAAAGWSARTVHDGDDVYLVTAVREDGPTC